MHWPAMKGCNIRTINLVSLEDGKMEKYKIFDEIEQIKCSKKSKWKKLVKDKIQQYVNKEYQRESKSMKKLRFVNEKQVKRKEYIEVCTTNEIENIIKTRLNVQVFKCNFKGKDKEIECPLCKEEQDTTEHVFQCEAIKRILGMKEMRCKDIVSEDVKVLKKVSQFMEKAKEIREKL